MKADGDDERRRSKVRLDRFMEEAERLKTKTHDLTERLHKRELALNKQETSNALIQNRSDTYKQKAEDASRKV
jgi:hypothetical protein